ncbi:MAG TPA: MFS transporter [Steroidobacteraceae bacterium]|jgi:MFS family permease
MWIATLAIGALYIGSTVLTPLYPIYQREFGISPLGVTVVYAVYVVGNLGVLFLFGRLSDQIGRRVTTLASFALTLLSAATFLLAGGMTGLMVGRAINGFAAGLGAAALTAWIAELEPRKNRSRAAIIASAGNLGGLAVGGILAGLLAQYVTAPLRIVFIVYLVVLIAMLVSLLRVKETAGSKPKRLADLDLRPRVGVPANIRLPFVAPACMAFAAFALGGFFSALVPGLVTRELHLSNVAVIGGIVTIFFAVACLTAALSRQLKSWTAMFAGAGCVFPGVALLVCAEAFRSMTWLLAAAVLSGVAMALSYRGSLQVVNEIAPQEHRAEVVSSYLLMCYLGNSLPVLGVGFLATFVAPPAAHATFAAVVAGLAVVAIIVGATNMKRINLKTIQPRI